MSMYWQAVAVLEQGVGLQISCAIYIQPWGKNCFMPHTVPVDHVLHPLSANWVLMVCSVEGLHCDKLNAALFYLFSFFLHMDGAIYSSFH